MKLSTSLVLLSAVAVQGFTPAAKFGATSSPTALNMATGTDTKVCFFFLYYYYIFD